MGRYNYTGNKREHGIRQHAVKRLEEAKCALTLILRLLHVDTETSPQSLLTAATIGPCHLLLLVPITELIDGKGFARWDQKDIGRSVADAILRYLNTQSPDYCEPGELKIAGFFKRQPQDLRSLIFATPAKCGRKAENTSILSASPMPSSTN